MSSNQPQRDLLPRAFAASGVVALGAILAVIAAAARHGYDWTDEGFYLNVIAHGSEGSVNVSMFGPVYRFLTSPLDGDVVSLRLFNIVTTAFAAVVLGWATSRYLCSTVGHTSTWARVACSTLIAIPALGVFATGQLTPNYNSLTVIGLLLLSAGLMLAAVQDPGIGVLPIAVLISAGGVIAFLGKPSSGPITAAVATAFLLMSGGRQRRTAATAAAIGLTMFAAVSWAITGDLLGLPRSVLSAAGEARLMESGHDLAGSLRRIHLLPRLSLPWLIVGGMLALVGLAWTKTMLAPSHARGWLITAMVSGAGSLPLIGALQLLTYTSPFRELLLLGLPLGIAAGALSIHNRPRGRALLLAGSLAVLPFALAFGSNNDYWHVASLLSVLWVLAAVLLAAEAARGSRLTWVRVTGVMVPAVVVTALGLSAWLIHPYRQPDPLFDQSHLTRVGHDRHLIEMSPGFARAISEFRRTSRAHGFSMGTPVIDLTGVMPGMIYAMDGTPAGTPWMLGGYPGSNAVAKRALARTPCEDLADAWLLMEHDGPRGIDPAILAAMGASLADWEPVSTVALRATPDVPLIGSSPEWDSRHVTLLGPVDSAPVRVGQCEAVRNGEGTATSGS